MNPRELQLRHNPASARETVAWFLPGAEPAVWLAEICRWAVPHEILQVFPVPGEGRIAGLLVLLPAGIASPVDARGLPLGVFASRLFLPIDAELSPPITDAEARTLCPAPVTLFHPGIGAIAFANEDCRRIWDLLERPAVNTGANWNGAVAGSALPSRLAGVTLLALPQGGEIFGSAGDEIGTAPALDLPPPPAEPRSSPAGRLGRALAGAGAAAVAKIFSLFPKTSARRTWANDVMDWAASKLAGISREMEHLRHRELHRLMHLLKSDPERGLRHALPLGGSAGRGRAAPGAKLGARDTRFNLARLGGGGPADHWDMPWELRQKLTARYRELALREQRLGRFQRAAYIHAELLGDLSAAAAVLKEGRLFAEAAALYRDHLRQTRAAAECFLAGGFFAEAIVLFEKEGAFLEIGDLHRRLGDEPAAAVAFRRAIEMKVNALDFTGAATLLEERLHVPEEALALLGKGWPHSPQAAPCLAAEFALLGKLGRHESARARLGALAEESTPPSHTIDLAEVLKGVREIYPDHAVRPVAADLARVKISERLEAADSPELRRAVRILHELAPEDRLLARDTSRFVVAQVTGRIPEISPPPRRPGTGRVGPPKLLKTFQLPEVTAVDAVKRCGRTFVALVRQKRAPVLLRGDWRGVVNCIPWPDGNADAERISLVLDEHDSSPNHVVPFSIPLPGRAIRVLAPTMRFPDPLIVAVPDWMPEGVLALATSGGQWWLLRGPAGDLIVEARGTDGRLTGSTSVNPWLPHLTEPLESSSVSILALGSRVWVSLDRHLFLIDQSKRRNYWRCESPIIGLEPTAPFLPCGVVARCEHGASVFWSDEPAASGEMLASDISAPLAVFLGNGTLVLLSSVAGPGGFAGQVLDLDRHHIHSTADFTWTGAWPVALVAADAPYSFAIFTRTGEVQILGITTGTK